MKVFRVIATTLVVLLSFCQALFALTPQAGEFLRKAKFQLDNGNLKGAEDYYKRALQIDPSESEIIAFGSILKNKIEERVKELTNKAFFLMQAKSLPEAEKLYREILMFQPDNSEAISNIEEIEKIKKAIKEYRKQGVVVEDSSGRSYDLSAYSSISNYSRAYSLFKKGDRAKAILLLKEILEKEPDHRAARELKEEIERVEELAGIIEKAESSFQSESMDSVIIAVTELLRKFPGQHHYHLMRARAYLKTRRYPEAARDLWEYYKYDENKALIFPLLSEVYELEGRYALALGFAYNREKKQYVRPFSSVIKNYFYAYYWTNLFFLVVIFCMLPTAIMFLWQSGENLFLKFSIGYLKKSLKCLAYISVGRMDACLKELIAVARDLNFPWLNYVTGLALLDNGDFQKAQRFLKFSISDSTISARAYYFQGISKKNLHQDSFEDDFERSVLCSLDKKVIRPWRPWFMRRLESRLLKRYEVLDNDSPESMAYRLLASIN